MSWSWAQNDVLELTVEGIQANYRTLNVLHFAAIEPLSEADGKIACDDFNLSWIAAGSGRDLMRACACPTWTMQGIRVQRIHTERMRSFPYVLPGAGTNAGTNATTNTACTIEKFTERATVVDKENPQGQIGSFHLPCPPISAVVGGTFPNAYLNGPILDFQQWMVADFTTLAGNIWTPVIWHRNAVPPTFTAVAGGQVQSTVRVMRRRTVGVGI